MSLFFNLFSKKKQNDIPKTVRLEPIDDSTSIGYMVSSLRGIGKRSSQQDAFYVKNARDVVEIKTNGLLAIVADGMGGMADGGKASGIVVETISNEFDKMDRKSDMAAQLENAVFAANEAVYHELRGKGGSTVIACIFLNEHLYYCGVGDSGLFLLRDGHFVRMNREQSCLHSAYLDTIRAGSIDPSYAESLSEKTALSQFVGMRDLDDVDCLVCPFPLQSGDTVLLCSDGVSSFISEDTIKACLSSGSPRDMTTRLEEEIRRGNHKYQDNYTAVVVQCCC